MRFDCPATVRTPDAVMFVAEAFVRVVCPVAESAVTDVVARNVFPETVSAVAEALASVVCPVTTSDVAVRAVRKEDAVV